MRTKVSVELDGVALSDIDSRIIIQSVKQATPVMKVNAVSFGSHIGQMVTSRDRQYIEINVQFAVAEKRDLTQRAYIVNQINAWAAAGSKMTVNYRPGYYLDVTCEKLAAVDYVFKWTGKYSLTFRAYAVPYWQSDSRTSAEPVENNAVLYVDGTAETPLEMEVTANGETTGVRVSDARGNTLDFAGLTMAEGDSLTVEHMGAIMVAKIGNQDALRYRTTASADEITLRPGYNALVVEVTGDADVTLYARGRLL